MSRDAGPEKPREPGRPVGRSRTETRSDLEAMGRGLLRASVPTGLPPGAGFYIDNLRYVLEGLLESDDRADRALAILNDIEWPSDQARLRAIEILKYGL